MLSPDAFATKDTKNTKILRDGEPVAFASFVSFVANDFVIFVANDFVIFVARAVVIFVASRVS